MADVFESIVQESNEVNALLERLVQEMLHVGEQIQQAGELIAQGRDRLLHDIETVSAAAQQLWQHFEEQAQQVHAQGSRTDQLAQVSSSQAAEMDQRFHAEITQTHSAFEEYSQGVAHCAQTLQTQQQDVETRLQAGHETLQQTQQAMQTQFEQSASALQAFEQHTQTLETEWTAFIADSVATLRNLEQETAQEVETHLLVAIDQQAQQFIGAVEHATTGPLAEGAQQTIATARDELEHQVKALISDIGQHFDSALNQISEELTQSMSSSSEVRELLKPVFEELQDLSDPLQQVVESVQQIAATVGVHV